MFALATGERMERHAVMPEPTVDGQLIRACQDGDREAFRLLFETYKDRVFSIAVYSLGDRAVADDVTQQIFLKLFTAIRQFRGDSEFTTWLYRMVVNACHDERRRTKRIAAWGDTVVEPSGDKKPQESQYARQEIAAVVQAAIGQLKPTFRMPILLKYVEGLSYEEIAEVMGCSKGTVASRLNRGHTELAKRLAHLRSTVVGE
jgi:RNA polymerase sigma factor, sigma-70 family